MTTPDTTINAPTVGSGLTAVGDAAATPAVPTTGPGRTQLDSAMGDVDGRAGRLSTSGQETASRSTAGVQDSINGDAKSAENFQRNGPTGSDGGAGSRGGPGSPLGAFKSNVPSSPASLLQSMGQPMQQLSGLAQPAQSMMSAPQQFLAPLTSLLGGGMPGGAGGGPMQPMAALGSFSDGSGGSSDVKARLDSFVASTAGSVDYAWGGGHGGMPGPSQGTTDHGGAADAHHDYAKTGVDCSGYSRWAYSQVTGHDVLGASTSQSQFAGGRPVHAPQPMDLAFPASAGRPPTHVQIYLGDGMIAEAPQSGEKVRIRPVSPGTEFRRYLAN